MLHCEIKLGGPLVVNFTRRYEAPAVEPQPSPPSMAVVRHLRGSSIRRKIVAQAVVVQAVI
jgi:hypothetical protein